jgi:4-hydroxybenzoate polyprenyltransferase
MQTIAFIKFSNFFKNTRIIFAKKIISFFGSILQPIHNRLKKHLLTKRNKPAIFTIILILLVADMFFITGNSDIRFFGIIGLYAFASFYYHLLSKYTFILCLILLVIMYISFLFSGASFFTEKTAVWIVLFMATGIIQQWSE